MTTLKDRDLLYRARNIHFDQHEKIRLLSEDADSEKTRNEIETIADLMRRISDRGYKNT